MRIEGARVFDLARGFVERPLFIQGGRLCAEAGGYAYDAKGCIIIPGLTDLHFHGCMGEDISDANPAGLKRMAEYQLSRGVTHICPAGMTLPEAQLLKMCRVAADHGRDDPPGAKLSGINLEGPFLSATKKGAQKEEWLRLPDLSLLKNLQKTSGGLCKLVSVAPELPGALEFISRAKAFIRVSLAHTDADYEMARKAFQAGACQVTHLFNAMPPFGHREPGVVGAALDSDCMVELIVDGVHLHPAMVRAAFKLFGPERIILISDSMRATGMPPGDYSLAGQAVKVQGNRAVLRDGTLAGSVTDLMGCMLCTVSMGIPLEQAVRAAAYNPAKALGEECQHGSLEPGKMADLVILNERMEIQAVLQKGQLVCGTLAS
ncbi:MAG: N-acetylglucosamine-6-phosphate deacetylase [Candidatus Pelethousia sp.]|nr:N-acetylglucosamine-6-phosphate deacetylase [Candidatus Pelethousia sp.]